jgi:hypothetical protein
LTKFIVSDGIVSPTSAALHRFECGEPYST